MKNISICISFVIIVSAFYPLHAQEFRGGEISCEYIYPTPTFKIGIDLYFKDTAAINQYEFIIVSYGDGNPDTLQVDEILDLENNIKLYRYQAEHVFIAHGLFPITVVNEFYLDDIINLSQPISFVLQTILLVDNFLMLINNYCPRFENLQTDYTIENGVFRHQLVSTDAEGPLIFRYENFYLNNVSSYSLPDATNSIDLDFVSGEFVWDKPVQPGKYLLAFELVEQGGIGYRQRFMIVEIKESDLTTNTLESNTNPLWLTVAPNPATDLLHLQLGGFHAPVQVRIFDALGQEVYETQVAAASQVETLRIPVAAWPSGVYSVQIESEGKVLTRQVAVQ